MMNSSISLILLAAGSGKRFKGDKLSFPVNGVPMLQHILQFYSSDSLKNIFTDKILVTQSSRSTESKYAQEVGFHVIYNDFPEEGISRSIKEGLSVAILNNPLGFMFSVCDQPYLSEFTVLSLINEFISYPKKIIAPFSERGRGNPVIFPSSYVSELMSLNGDVGGSKIINLHLDMLRTIPVSEKELTDIDYKPENYR